MTIHPVTSLHPVYTREARTALKAVDFRGETAQQLSPKMVEIRAQKQRSRHMANSVLPACGVQSTETMPGPLGPVRFVVGSARDHVIVYDVTSSR